jgi:hypothetical protein
MCYQERYQIIFPLLFLEFNTLSGKFISVLGENIKVKALFSYLPSVWRKQATACLLYYAHTWLVKLFVIIYILLRLNILWLLFSDKNSTSNMKIDTLTFLSCILTQHSPTVFHPHISVLLPVSVWIFDKEIGPLHPLPPLDLPCTPPPLHPPLCTHPPCTLPFAPLSIATLPCTPLSILHFSLLPLSILHPSTFLPKLPCRGEEYPLSSLVSPSLTSSLNFWRNSLFQPVIVSVGDSFYKITSEALLVMQELVKVIRPFKG